MTYKSTIRYFSKKFKPGRHRPDPKKLEDVMTQSSLQSILKKSQELDALNQLLHAQLSAQLGLHCDVMNIDENTLTISVNDANWIHQLRFQELDILHAFRRRIGLQGLKQIKYKIKRFD